MTHGNQLGLPLGRVTTDGGWAAQLHLLAIRSLLRTSAPFNLRGFSPACRVMQRWVAPEVYYSEVSVGESSVFSYPTWDDYWARWFLLGNRYEPGMERFLVKLRSQQFAFIDGGANFGYWSIILSSPEFGARSVVAIEAAPSTYHVLQRNCQRNQRRFITVNRALSDRPGRALTFAIGSNHAASHIVPDASAAMRGEQTVVVPSTTLAEIARDYLSNEVSFLIKLDVEGAEIHSIEGAGGLIDRDTVLIYEDHGQDRESKTTSWLLDRGFEIIHPADNGVVYRVNEIGTLDRIKTNLQTGYNFLALRGQGPFSASVRALCQ